jgi:hypothetical protein
MKIYAPHYFGNKGHGEFLYDFPGTVTLFSPHNMAQLAMFVDALVSEQTLWGGHYALWCVPQRNNRRIQRC